MCSLDCPPKSTKATDGSLLMDLVADESQEGLDRLEADVDYSVLFTTMQQLDEKEQLVLKHRYQIDGADYLTLAEIGKRIHVCRERVRQIERKAVLKLRGLMRNQPINFRSVPIPLETFAEQLELEVAA